MDKKSNGHTSKSEHHSKDKPEVVELDRLVESNFGSIIFLVGLTFAAQLTSYSCHKYQCRDIPLAEWIIANISNPVALLKELFPIPNLPSVLFYVGFVIIEWILHFILPAYYGYGQPQLYNGQRLTYKYNCFLAFLLSIGALIGTTYLEIFDPSFVVNNIISITVAAQAFSWILSVLLYIKGIIYQDGAPSGKWILDFFYGYDPNPRVLGFIAGDVKFFAETRALMGWYLVDMCILWTQYKQLGYITTGVGLIFLFHTIYIFQAIYKEPMLVTMLDFIGDNMGFMLTWGNLCWVILVFPVPMMYAYKNAIEVPYVLGAAIIAFHLSGFLIFYGTNKQKFQFKSDPTKPIWGKKPKVIPTKGSGILISGFWGLSRKMNYCGDLMVALSFSLPTMTFGIIPYLYFLYLFVLLVHRQYRDEQWCKAKYGEAWDQYCKAVPYKIVPYIY